MYGDTFWLIDVFAPEDVRKYRLKSFEHVALQKVMDVDEEEEDADYGQ